MTSSFPEELDRIIEKEEETPSFQNDSEGSIELQVNEQLNQLGDDPSLVQAVTVLLKQSVQAQQEARQARAQYEKILLRH